MEQKLYEKREHAYRMIVGEEGVSTRRGFLDTTRGLVLTSGAALDLARKKSTAYHEKQRKAAEREAARERAEIESIRRSERARWAVRARQAGVSINEFRQKVRPMSVRRAVAKQRAVCRAIQQQEATVALLELSARE